MWPTRKIFRKKFKFLFLDKLENKPIVKCSYSGANSMTNNTSENSFRRKRKLSPADLEETGGPVMHSAHDNLDKNTVIETSKQHSNELTDINDHMVSQGIKMFVLTFFAYVYFKNPNLKP